MKRSIGIWMFALALLLLTGGCEPLEHSFSNEELQTIDSLYKLQQDSLEELAKKRCDSVFSVEFRPQVDSLKQIRQKEILEIISK